MSCINIFDVISFISGLLIVASKLCDQVPDRGGVFFFIIRQHIGDTSGSISLVTALVQYSERVAKFFWGIWDNTYM
jgi:hypothetical protein